MGLLDDDLATIIGGAIDFMMLDGTLRRDTVASLNSSYGDPVAGTPSTYSFRGFDDDFDAAYRMRAGIPQTDTRISIMASSVASAPMQDDRISFRGSWWQIRRVVSDPARAVYECQVFKVGAP